MGVPDLFERAREEVRAHPRPHVGRGPGEQAAADLLSQHAAFEASFVRAYRALGARHAAPGVQFFSEMLADDEEHHHRLCQDMLASLSDLDQRRARHGRGIDQRRRRPDAIAAVSRLIALERRRAEGLRRLRRELRTMTDNGETVLLVELLESDCAKHLHVLRYLRHQAGAGRPAPLCALV